MSDLLAREQTGMKKQTTCVVESEIDQPRARGINPVGLMIVAVLPALFWTAVISQVAWAAGINLSMTVLALIACAIGGFLSVIYAALVVGAKIPATSSSEHHASTTPAAAQPAAFPSAATNSAARSDKPADPAAV